MLEVQVVDGHTLVLRARFMVDRDQARVWSTPWLDRLRHARGDVETGHTTSGPWTRDRGDVAGLFTVS